MEAHLRGDLAAILALSDGKGHKQKLPAKDKAGSQPSAPAGEIAWAWWWFANFLLWAFLSLANRRIDIRMVRFWRST